jgi:hypothetical protein
MIIRIYWKLAQDGSEAVHCRLFIASQPLDRFGHAGDLVLNKQQFVALSAGRFQAEFFEEDEIERG